MYARAPGGIGYRWVTGMAIVRAIVGGERDARQLAQLRDRRRHQSEEAIAEQLSGHWRADHLFTLGQALKMCARVHSSDPGSSASAVANLQSPPPEWLCLAPGSVACTPVRPAGTSLAAARN